MCIAVRRKYFDNPVTDIDNGNIEGTASQVINHDFLLGLVFQTVSKGCRCRLVNDSLYGKTGNLTGILCCLSLCIVEISRNGNDRLGYFLSQIALGIRL